MIYCKHSTINKFKWFMSFKIQNSNSSQSVSRSEEPISSVKKENVKEVGQKIFKAKSAASIDYTWKDQVKKGLIFTAKWLFFPITLPLSYVIKKVAREKGIGDRAAKNVNQSALNDLIELGGEEIHFRTEDRIKLEGMIFKNSNSNPSGKTVLVCSGSHQSSENYNPAIVQALLAMGHDVMTFNYRGFGHSKGHPSESGLYKDGEAAYQYLHNLGIDNEHLVVYGYSLGGAVAADIAAKHPVNVVLDRAFSSGPDRAAKGMPNGMKWIARLVAFTGCNFNNKEKMKYIKGKVFIAQESGAESFLARMKRALEKAHHKKIETLEESGDVTTIQLETGHFHSKADLWFGEENEDTTGKAKLENFLNL